MDTFLNTSADKPISIPAKSWGILVPLTVDPATGALSIPAGYAIVHSGAERSPRFANPPWDKTEHTLDAGPGIGQLLLHDAVPRIWRSAEYFNEHGRLYAYEFDATKPPSRWLDDSGWLASFEPPLEGDKSADETRYLFHRTSLGPQQNRWTYSAHCSRTNGVTDSVWLTTPMIGPTFLGTLLKAASFDTTTGYMPRLDVATSYGQDDRPDATWSHFDRPPPSKQPGPVTGFVMVVQGGFKKIPIDQLDAWDMSPAEGCNVESISRRFAGVLCQYPVFQRTFDTLAQSEKNSVIKPPAGELPVEVLFLKGLASSRPVFPDPKGVARPSCGD